MRIEIIFAKEERESWGDQAGWRFVVVDSVGEDTDKKLKQQ